MATLMIEDVPEELCCRFRLMAEKDRRSIVDDFLKRIERCTAPPVTPDVLARQLKADREFTRRMTRIPMTPEQIEEAIAEGRP